MNWFGWVLGCYAVSILIYAYARPGDRRRRRAHSVSGVLHGGPYRVKKGKHWAGGLGLLT